MERLLDNGKFVVKKAYSDLARYGTATRPSREVAFELAENPHLSNSGKQVADIRLVVDGLDLYYTKAYIDQAV